MGKRIVITGGPCSGKSEVIAELERRGYPVIKEIARTVIQERKSIPWSVIEYESRQRTIFFRQLEAEKEFEDFPIVFLDRSLVDCFAYLRYYVKRIPQEFLCFSPLELEERYWQVFFLEAEKFERDDVRVEKDEKEVRELNAETIRVYKEVGHDAVSVPVISVAERVEFILEKINGGNIHEGC